MKRFLSFAAILFLTGSVFAGSPWWDDRLDGVYLPGFDGAVLYDMDLVEAPISLPEPVGFYPGRVVCDGPTMVFTDYYGNEYAGTFHAETGCYLSSVDVGDTVIALCYHGARDLDVWYGTLSWNGSQGILVGPWLFHVYVFAPDSPWPMYRPGDTSAVLE